MLGGSNTGLTGCGIRVIENGGKMRRDRNLISETRDKNTSVGTEFAHFDRQGTE